LRICETSLIGVYETETETSTETSGSAQLA